MVKMPLDTDPSCPQSYQEIDGEVYLRHENGLLVVYPVEVRDEFGALGMFAEKPGKRRLATFPRNGLEEGMYDARILDILKGAEGDTSSHVHAGTFSDSLSVQSFQVVRGRFLTFVRNIFRQ